jgi:hypothetical protein
MIFPISHARYVVKKIKRVAEKHGRRSLFHPYYGQLPASTLALADRMLCRVCVTTAATLGSSIRLPACRSVSEVRNKYLNINYLKYRLVFDAAPLDKQTLGYGMEEVTG